MTSPLLTKEKNDDNNHYENVNVLHLVYPENKHNHLRYPHLSSYGL